MNVTTLALLLSPAYAGKEDRLDLDNTLHKLRFTIAHCSRLGICFLLLPQHTSDQHVHLPTSDMNGRSSRAHDTLGHVYHPLVRRADQDGV